MQRRVFSLMSDAKYCRRQLKKIERHFGYNVADKPYACVLGIPQRNVPTEVLQQCYVVHVDERHQAFAAQVELVRTAGNKVELYFASFLPFVQEGGGRIETVGTHLVLGPIVYVLPFSPAAAEHLGCTRPPELPT